MITRCCGPWGSECEWRLGWMVHACMYALPLSNHYTANTSTFPSALQPFHHTNTPPPPSYTPFPPLHSFGPDRAAAVHKGFATWRGAAWHGANLTSFPPPPPPYQKMEYSFPPEVSGHVCLVGGMWACDIVGDGGSCRDLMGVGIARGHAMFTITETTLIPPSCNQDSIHLFHLPHIDRPLRLHGAGGLLPAPRPLRQFHDPAGRADTVGGVDGWVWGGGGVVCIRMCVCSRGSEWVYA